MRCQAELCPYWPGEGCVSGVMPCGEAQVPACKPGHRLRDGPYPDEVDQQFCEECKTLCMEGRPCECCWAEAEGALPPRCTCHGLPVHVHPDNGKLDPHGRDPGRGWNWHCPLDDCAGYSRIILVTASAESPAAAAPPPR